MYACVKVCAYVYTYEFAYMYEYAYEYRYVYENVHVYVHVQMCIYMLAYVKVYHAHEPVYAAVSHLFKRLWIPGGNVARLGFPSIGDSPSPKRPKHPQET